MATFNEAGLGDDFLHSVQNREPIIPPEMGMMERIGTLTATAPFRAASNFAASAANILGLPDEAKGGFLPQEDQALPEARTTSQNVVNFLGGAIAPAALELAATGKFIPRIPVGVGAGSVLPQVTNRVIQNASGFGILGAQEDRTTGLEQTAEGAALGGLSALGLPGRIAGSVALGLGSKAFFDSRHPEAIGNFGGFKPTQGDVSGILQGIFGILGGRVTEIPHTISSGAWEGPHQPLMLEGPIAQADPSIQRINPRDVNVGPGQFGQSGVFYPEATTPAARVEPTFPPDIEGQFQRVEAPANPLLTQGDFASRAKPITDFQQPQDIPLLESRVPGVVRGPKFPFRNQPEVVPLEGPIRPIGNIEIGQPTTPPFIQELFHPANADYLKQKLGVDIAQPEAQTAFMQLATALTTREVRMSNRQQAIAFARFFEQLHNRPDIPELSRPPVPEGAFEETVKAGQPLQLPEINKAALDIFKKDAGYTSPLQSMTEGNPIQRQLNEVRQRLKAAEDALRLGEADEDTPFEINSLQRVEAELAKRLSAKVPNAPIDSAVQSAEQVKQARSKSKIPDLPEYRRTEGGFVDRDYARVAGFAAFRGIAGYALGSAIANHDPNEEYDPVTTGLLFAGIAIASPYGRRLIDFAQKFKQRIHAPGIADSGNRGLPPYRSTVRVGDYDPAMSYGNTVEREIWEAGAKDKEAARQRLEAEQTVKGKVSSLPEYMRSEGGFLIPELQAALGRSAIGGLAGGAIGSWTEDPGESGGFVRGAWKGALAVMLGPSIARAALRALEQKKTSPSSPKPAGSQALKGGISKFVTDFKSNLEERFGATFNGSELVGDRLLRALDKGFHISMPTEIKEALMQAKGVGSFLLDQVDKSLLKVSLRFKPNEVVKDLTNSYLDGQVDAAGYLHSMQSHIATDPNMKAYADFAITARTSITGLQKMVRDGITDPKLRSIIDKSLDKYITRSYRIFNDPRWTPNDATFAKLAQEIHQGEFFGKGVAYNDIQSALRQYIREIKQTKGTYAPVNPEGVKIGQQVLKERKDLSPAWKEFLGEVRDPTERIYQTVFRLRPMAEAAKFFDKIASLDVKGLPQVFDSSADLEAFRQKVQTKLAADPNNADLKFQDAALKSYQFVEDQQAYGQLKGKMVSRGVWDNLKTFDSTTEITNPIWRSFANINTAIKLNRTALNPIAIIRNMVTSPAFMLIGRTNPVDVVEAGKILLNRDHPMIKEILEMGIGNVDQVKTEFYKEYQNAIGSKYNFGSLDGASLGLGTIDLDLAEKVGRRGFRYWLDFYRAPDNLVRIGSYLSAKRRIAEELGLGLDSQIVKEKAAQFTNRYTMNYDAIVPAIKAARNIPLFNLFLSYTAEMGRIGLNLAEDVITGKGDGLTQHGRIFAMIPLAAISVLPEIAQQSAEDSLSPKDKADWEKAKKLMPDYARTRYFLDIQRKPNGQFIYTDYTSWLPHDAYQQMVKAIANKDWEALAAVNPLLGTQNSPVVNIGVSQLQGKDLHTQRPFRTTDLFTNLSDRFASVAKETLPPNVPEIGSEAIRYRQSHTPNAEGEEGTTNLRTGNVLHPSDFWLPYFSGLKTGGANLSVLEKKAESQAKQEVANEIAYANDILKSDAAPAIKKQQLEKTKAALLLIRQRYAALLGVNEQPSLTANNEAASSRQ